MHKLYFLGDKEMKKNYLFKSAIMALTIGCACMETNVEVMASYQDLEIQNLGDNEDTITFKGKEVNSISELCQIIENEGYTVSNDMRLISEIIIEMKLNGYSDEEIYDNIQLLWNRRGIYTEAKSVWESLTDEEKLLAIAYPKEAIIVDSCRERAYQYTVDKFGYNGLGDKSDGYRHAMWNALMTRDLNSRALAEAFATAHEDIDSSLLQNREADGYTKKRHREMDLHNNEIGRDLVGTWEFSFNLSDSTLKKRISSKLTNNNGGIIWLHK